MLPKKLSPREQLRIIRLKRKETFRGCSGGSAARVTLLEGWAASDFPNRSEREQFFNAPEGVANAYFERFNPCGQHAALFDAAVDDVLSRNRLTKAR